MAEVCTPLSKNPLTQPLPLEPGLEEEQGWPAHAVFVEQRLYPMCARKLGLDPTFFLQNYQGKKLADGTENNVFTHLWVYKTKLMKNKAERQSICVRMVRRILQDFPEVGDVLSTISSVRPYLALSSC
jgi:hypothetical protein